MLGNPHVLVRVSRPTHPSSCGPGSLRRAGTGGWLGAALRPPCLPGPLLWCAAGVQRGERRVHGLRPAAGAAGPEAVSPARAPGRPALPPPPPLQPSVPWGGAGPLLERCTVGVTPPCPGYTGQHGHPVKATLPRRHPQPATTRPGPGPCGDPSSRPASPPLPISDEAGTWLGPETREDREPCGSAEAHVAARRSQPGAAGLLVQPWPRAQGPPGRSAAAHAASALRCTPSPK